MLKESDMTTLEERLDELLAMSRNLGYLEAKATAAEHRADMAPRGSTRRPRREARELISIPRRG